MCGIVGQAVYEGAADCAALQRGLDAIAHRGPDDAGLQLVASDGPGAQVLLGSRRLAILDLSPAGHQPMHDTDTGNWIVHNGEVFNFHAVRQELERHGASFRSRSDTEVILKAYAAWGEDCLERFRGMFAFALWDAARRRLFLCRDRLGIKPLYYYTAGRQLLFGSEVRSLLATELVPRRLRLPSVADYLSVGSVCDPDTLIEGVHALAAGTYAVWESGKLRQVQYWDTTRACGTPPPKVTREEVLPRLREQLQEAVSLRLVSDVPVGIFLSGGIDSSALVSLVGESTRKVSTFSIVFREGAFSEAPFSSVVSRYFGTEHHEVMLGRDDFRDALPDALRALDQPSVDGVNTYIVSREVRRQGLKVALSGLGSDEIFGGYASFRRIPQLQRVLRWVHTVPRPLRRLASRAMRAATAGDANAKVAELIGIGNHLDAAYFVSRTLFLAGDRERLLTQRADREITARLDSLAPEFAAHDPVNRLSHLELRNYLRNTLLRDADCMSMAHSLELRVPFLDHKLVEFVTALPGNLKLDRSTPKPLLVHALRRPLPDGVVHRPKRGFTLPFTLWMRGPMRAELAGVFDGWSNGPLAEVLHAQAVQRVWTRFLEGRTSWSRPWALFVLSRWVENNVA